MINNEVMACNPRYNNLNVFCCFFCFLLVFFGYDVMITNAL